MKILFKGSLKSLVTVILSFFVIIYCIGGGIFLEDDITSSELFRKRDIFNPVFDTRKTFSVFFKNILTPGMRNIMVDLLLIEVHDLWHQRRWYRISEYLEIVTMLQPEWLEGWELGSWHMAYNVTYQIIESPFLSQPQKDKEVAWWFDRSTRMLKSGIVLNSDNYRLYFYLGWTYYHRMRDYDNAIKYFTKASRFTDHDNRAERFIAYSYEKGGNPEKALEILTDLRQDTAYHNNVPWVLRVLDLNIERIQQKTGKNDLRHNQ